jgi:O-antigen/teichoic acid export membrane protein
LAQSIDSQFSKGFAWMAIGSLAEQGTNAVVFLLLARLLRPEGFGLWAMAAAILLMCEALVRETLSDYVIAADDNSDVVRNTVFWCLIVIGVLLGLVLALAAQPVAQMYRQPQVAHLLYALTVVPVLIASSAVPAALLRREMQFRALSLRAVGGMIAGGVVGVGMAIAGYGVWALVMQRIVQSAVNAVAAWVAMGWVPGFNVDRTLLRPLIRFGSGILGVRAADLCVVQLPSAAIGALHGPVMLGYFSIAWRIAELSSFIVTTPLRLASQSAFAAMIRSAAHDAAELLVDLTRLSAFLAFPVFAALAVLSHPVLMVLAGRSWGTSARALSVLALYGAYLCIAKLWGSFMLARKRPGKLARVQWGEVVTATLLIVVGSRAGPAMAASLLLLAILAFAPFRMRGVTRAGDITYGELLRPLLMPALGALLAGGVVYCVNDAIAADRPIWRLVSGLTIGFVIYAGWTAVFLRDRVTLLVYRFGKQPAQPLAVRG